MHSLDIHSSIIIILLTERNLITRPEFPAHGIAHRIFSLVDGADTRPNRQQKIAKNNRLHTAIWRIARKYVYDKSLFRVAPCGPT